MKYWPLLLFITIVLGGCSSTMVIPGEEVIDASGNIITKTAETVGDTSSYRTHEKYKAWNTANHEYTEAVKASGFQMEFQMVKVGDQQMYLPKKISFRESPQFHAPADLTPHPVWHTLDTAISTITPWGFGAWMTGSIVGGFEHAMDSAGDSYAGPVMMQGSHNTAGRDQAITVKDSPIYNAGTTSDNSFIGRKYNDGEQSDLEQCLDDPPAGTPNGIPSYTPGCSCKSHFEGKC